LIVRHPGTVSETNVLGAGLPVIACEDAPNLATHTGERRYRSWYNRKP
jgi:hypothetical protein